MSDTNTDAWVSSSHRPMGFPEFVVMIASIMALNPLAMDMMLPALPNIASAFHITIANEPQAVLSAFLIGFGVGQFIMGPLSDHFGRRPVLIDGMALYCIASVLAITPYSAGQGLRYRHPIWVTLGTIAKTDTCMRAYSESGQ